MNIQNSNFKEEIRTLLVKEKYSFIELSPHASGTANPQAKVLNPHRHHEFFVHIHCL